MPLSKGKETVSSPALESRSVSALQVNTAHNTQQKGVFPPFDTTYFASHILWLAVCFGFFYFFMARVVLPRIGEIIETRRDRIAADLDQSARMKTEADAAAEAYQKNLSEARNQAKTIAHMTAEDAKTKAEAERKAFETGLEEKLAKAEEHVAACRNKALTEVDIIAGEIAADIVQKISGKKADKTALAQAIAAAGGTGSAAL
ncbi:MAG: ATP F0F1 synthase subunit B' [Candidatus Tokpelaia sp.]|nr:MAG: ATP F0F1 synthase subunit B' [Candidatus Tokpelaia sp.]KAA6206761.1 MAG: ATP F0F1 synthase subunit B' [Candidatus Tokpelaia sp.]KAA6405337.1 ATP F0F1 synthase subunit B' [Candidatus Tokpelaia sp.]